MKFFARHASPASFDKSAVRSLQFAANQSSVVPPTAEHRLPTADCQLPTSFHPSRVTRHASRDLTLYSTSLFLSAALLVQFLLNGYTALLLHAFGISFRYGLFGITFLSQSSLAPLPGTLAEGIATAWTEDRIYLIYGSGPLVMAALGMTVLFFQRKMRHLGWRSRLMLTWTAFLLINTLPCGILAGNFFYEGFGVFLRWFVPNSMARVVIALLAMAFMLFFSGNWHRRFLSASCSPDLIDTGRQQRTYLINVFLKPWAIGFPVLLLYGWPFTNFYWRAFLLALGWLALPLIDRNLRMHLHLHVRRREPEAIFSARRITVTAIVLLLIWLAGNMTFDI